jgi:hypothetical protein
MINHSIIFTNREDKDQRIDQRIDLNEICDKITITMNFRKKTEK